MLEERNGIKYHPDNKQYTGKVYKNYSDGSLEHQGSYKDGKKNEVWVSYDRDGKVWLRESYNNGIKNGKCTFYIENGKKSSEGNYTDGKLKGDWTYYYENGKVKLHGNWINGIFQRDDCNGILGGTATLDNCGICDDDLSNDCVQDCFDVWGGTDFDQGCGCGIYDQLPTDGCDDVCGSTAVVDNCDTCDDDASNDCVQDCKGERGGTSVVDECGVCDGEGPPDICITTLCVDRLGKWICPSSQYRWIPGGTVPPPSLLFVPPPSLLFSNQSQCNKDCTICTPACDCYGNEDFGCGCGESGPTGCDNTCGSTLENDECGVCGGDGIPEGDCNCFGNQIDCAGICGGLTYEDCSGICGGDAKSITCYRDWDGDQTGHPNTAKLFCSDHGCPYGMVAYSSDLCEKVYVVNFIGIEWNNRFCVHPILFIGKTKYLEDNFLLLSIFFQRSIIITIPIYIMFLIIIRKSLYFSIRYHPYYILFFIVIFAICYHFVNLLDRFGF